MYPSKKGTRFVTLEVSLPTTNPALDNRTSGMQRNLRMIKTPLHLHTLCVLRNDSIQDENIRMFLEETTSLDPRFKTKILTPAADLDNV